jgi:hypothetical protein
MIFDASVLDIKDNSDLRYVIWNALVNDKIDLTDGVEITKSQHNAILGKSVSCDGYGFSSVEKRKEVGNVDGIKIFIKEGVSE